MVGLQVGVTTVAVCSKLLENWQFTLTNRDMSVVGTVVDDSSGQSIRPDRFWIEQRKLKKRRTFWLNLWTK